MSGDNRYAGDRPSLLFPQAQARSSEGEGSLCQRKGLYKGVALGGHPGDPMHFESPPNSAPWFGTPNEGLLGSQACLSVSGLLAFATVLRDRLF